MEMTEAAITLIVRVRLGPGGEVSGIVERVKTGEKRSFRGNEGMSATIAELVRRETDEPGGRNP